jgi:site-specific DNA-cytosine methylase
MLELFAGTAHMSQAFRDEGWDTFTVDYNRRFDVDCHADIGSLDAGTILERFGRPDVVWASPDCTTFSIAAISHHRRRDPDTGYLLPVSPYATRSTAM